MIAAVARVREHVAHAFLCLVIPACCLLSACATQTPPAPQQMFEPRWDAYIARTAQVQSNTAPYRVSVSLRYSNEADSRRVTALLWGNDAAALRLDVNAGIGVTVASIVEDDSHFMVYAPRENRAYFHQGSQKPLLDVGVPLPVGVRDLGRLVRGDMSQLFGREYTGTPTLTPEGNVRYTVHGQLPGALSLNAHGQVVDWRQQPTADGAWTVSFEYPDGDALEPDKIKVNHSKGKKAIILVKERSTPPRPFTQAQLRLTLPEGVPVLPLRRIDAAQSI